MNTIEEILYDNELELWTVDDFNCSTHLAVLIEFAEAKGYFNKKLNKFIKYQVTDVEIVEDIDIDRLFTRDQLDLWVAQEFETQVQDDDWYCISELIFMGVEVQCITITASLPEAGFIRVGYLRMTLPDAPLGDSVVVEMPGNPWEQYYSDEPNRNRNWVRIVDDLQMSIHFDD